MEEGGSLKKRLRKFLSLALMLAILFTMFPMGASVSSAASGQNFNL
jgi:hypothetical protein